MPVSQIPACCIRLAKPQSDARFELTTPMGSQDCYDAWWQGNDANRSPDEDVHLCVTDAARDQELARAKISNGVANSMTAAPPATKRRKTCKSDKPLDAFGHHGLAKNGPTLNRPRPSRSRRKQAS
jgi:hypothetical protein